VASFTCSDRREHNHYTLVNASLEEAGRFDIIDKAMSLISIYRVIMMDYMLAYEKYVEQHGVDSPDLHAGDMLFEA